MIDFLREHKVLLLALLPIVFGFAGSWLGGWVQARGGIAQAKAAKEAAETAATATLQGVREQAELSATAAHDAALRQQRTTAAADLIRTDRALTRVLHTMFRGAGAEAATPAYDDFLQAWGMVQLVAPAPLANAATRVLDASQDLHRLARRRGMALWLYIQTASVPGWDPDHEAAQRAVEALNAWRAAYAAEDANMMEAHDAASDALARVNTLSSEQASALLTDCMEPGIEPVLAECWRAHDTAMASFVSHARTALGVSD